MSSVLELVQYYINTALALGVVQGEVAGVTFNPNNVATRGEQFQILYNLIKVKLAKPSAVSTTVKTAADFADGAEVPTWFEVAVAELLKTGIIEGNADGTLAIKKGLTVAEAATLLDRIS